MVRSRGPGVDQTRQRQLWLRAGRLPQAAVALVLPLCVIVLAGWALRGQDVLTSALPGVPAMVPASAACLMLTAVATLWLLKGSPTRHWLAGIAAALVTAAGVVTLLSYFWYPSTTQLSGLLSGHRMSPHTASVLVLLNLSLLMVDRRGWGTTRSQLLALAAMLIPLTVLLGYAFAEHRIYRLGGGIGAAPHNAAAQLVLALGILFLRPDQGPVATVTSVAAGGVMARRLLFAGLLPLAVGVLVDLGVRRGLVEARLAWPLFATTMMVALTAVVWRAARVSNRLHQEQARAWKQAGEEAELQRRLASENARLAQTAEAAAREREDVLAIVSHDLKNPLATVRLSAAVLQQKLSRVPGGEALVCRVAAMDRAALHMLGLITELLDAARLDAGQPLAVEPRPEPVGEVIGEALALIEPQATRGELRLVQHLTPGLVALCDRERILQVLANLLGNAVKFTPAGGTVTVEARTEDGEARVVVRDTGPGIPEDEQPRLFERHWQSRGTARQGSGLGLYIARGLVEAHGGRLWVESRTGAGSTFSFTLPLPPGRRLPHPALDSPGAEV
ncbi:HAMP domain-containing histidine kinase [Pyxidicoccus parkwayensis]|uniref:histidine kinase n=1 Tax=Pyxidicoccus parkwayensis TaxID=2813578 RepID=A0ABX7NWA0_9BACT|nr:HAMP domain-containing sensor histidine kinase [Pyxidicoccus parkwaysis]QSQ23075.1 HAMP domain-containing histidine kinase [Pyxidicoccus parkwaysis]